MAEAGADAGELSGADSRPAALSVRVRNRVRGVLSWIRHLPDRLLHPYRRRRARRALARLDGPSSVAFVCHGNICRSPYAAELLRELISSAGRALEIASAGFHPVEGRPSPVEAIRAADRAGIDLSTHRSTVLPLRDPGTGLVVVMEPRQRRRIERVWGRSDGSVVLLGDLDPGPIRTRGIVDPYGRSEAEFDAVYDRIDRCVTELAASLTREE